MKQLFGHLSTGSVELRDICIPTPGPSEVLIEARAGLVSLGTERMLLEFGKSNWIQRAKRHPDKVQQVITKIRNDGLNATLGAIKSKLDNPLPLGYSQAGVVREVGREVSGIRPGDRVVSNGPHAQYVCVEKSFVTLIPDQVTFEQAAFTVVGSVGLQGIRLARPQLGDRVVVIGLGLIGLITAQLLQASGAEVLGLDTDASKVEKAKQLGLKAYQNTHIQFMTKQILNWSEDFGADATIITAATASSAPVDLAVEITRRKGKVVLVGVAGLELDRNAFYKKELEFSVSCAYGAGRYHGEYEKGVDFPQEYVPWTAQRNFGAFLRRIAQGSVVVEPLIVEKIDFMDSDAVTAVYGELHHKKTLGILLCYPQTSPQQLLRKIEFPQHITPGPGEASPPPASNIGWIGHGHFSQRVLLPQFIQHKANIVAICGRKSLPSHFLAQQYQLQMTTSDYRELIADPRVQTVVIATPHHLHASMVREALQAKKNVFVEKPLALNINELEQIESLLAQENCPLLMVGYNRRFSPLIGQIHHALKERIAPLNLIYHVNAGELPRDHWTLDPKVGGGRLLGEACHFVDTARFLTGQEIVSEKLHVAKIDTQDIFTINLNFADGSLATIHYYSNGPSQLPKERMEIYCSGGSVWMDNFRSITAYGHFPLKSKKFSQQEKGHSEEVKTFLECLDCPSPWPIEAKEMIEVSRVMLRLQRQLETHS